MVIALQQEVQVDATGRALITCPQCHYAKHVNVAQHTTLHMPLRGKCRCGYRFDILLDTRHIPRKHTHLPGIFSSISTLEKLSSQEVISMTVVDLSLEGLGFVMRAPHHIHQEDVLRVTFILDDAMKTIVSKAATIRWVQDTHVGAAFCYTNALQDELRSYFAPATLPGHLPPGILPG